MSLPATAVGGNDEREDYLIANANGALRLSDGRIVIGDARLRQVRYYDARGQHIRTEGSWGNGPGQFQRLGRILRAQNDTVFVWDQISNRYTLLPPEAGPPITRTIPNLRGILEDLRRGHFRGNIVGFEAHRLSRGRTALQPIVSPAVPQDTRLVRDTVPLLTIDDGGVVSELGAFPGTLRFAYRGIALIVPFSDRLHVAAGMEFIAVAAGKGPTVDLIAPTGELVGRITVPAPRIPVMASDREQAASRIVNGVASSYRSQFVEMFEHMPWPDSLPLISDLRVDADQRVWVRLYAPPTAETQSWMAFEPTGTPAGTLSLAAETQLLDMGADFAITLHSDHLGVQEVRMQAILLEPHPP